jgi:folate-binding protein YgfZ
MSPLFTPDTALAEQILAVRRHAGAWQRNDHGFVRVTGPDAAAWLQTQTTNNVAGLDSGHGQPSAHLDRKAHVIAAFSLHRWEDEYWLIVPGTAREAFLASLDAHLFLEKAELHDDSAELDQIVLQGPRAIAVLLACAPGAARDLPPSPYGVAPVEIDGIQALAFRVSLTGEDGFVFLTERGSGPALLDILHAHGAAEIGPDAREILRIEGGIPRAGKDYSAENRLPETTLERIAVDYGKGCYVGQEVVAKMKAYTAPKFALMGLVFPGDAPLPDANAPLFLDGERFGAVRSACHSPTLGAPIAIAYVERVHRAPGATCTLQLGEGGPLAETRIAALPFVEATPAAERAQALYEEALARFEQDAHDEDDTAIQLLQEAVLIAPSFEDAYESLGVILNRHGRVDEAIAIMEQLAAMNPDCIMAHTNLSVFYMQQGRIEEAEEEKAKSAVLQMAQVRQQKKAADIAAEERARIEQEARNRIAMFAEVLEIDPDDPLATFGMGTAQMQLQAYAEAIPHLEQATRVQKDYSAAFLNLGKCHEFLGDAESAIAAYRAGIAAANRKGDLMPMREMERRLKGIEESQANA